MFKQASSPANYRFDLDWVEDADVKTLALYFLDITQIFYLTPQSMMDD